LARACEAAVRHAGLVAHTYEGAALCYREYCRLGQLEPDGYPDITLDHIDFRLSQPLWNDGDYAGVRALLSRSVDRLARAGAEFFFCSANTAHVALEADGRGFALPGLHIADVVAAAAAEEGRRKVAVLGTRFTMHAPMYRRALQRYGIEAALPIASDQEAIDRMIFGELVYGVFEERTRTACLGIVERLAAAGCDSVVLACTEIPLLLGEGGEAALPVLDSTRLLSRAALRVGLGKLAPPTWRGGLPAA
jgi:aspartate racemase